MEAPAAERVNSRGCAGVETTRLGEKRQSSRLQASALGSGATVSTAVIGAETYRSEAASVAPIADACTETTRCTVNVRSAAAGGAAVLTRSVGPALLAGCAATDSAGPAAVAAATAAASQTTLAAAHAASRGTPWRPVEHMHSHVTAAVAKAALAAAATNEDHMGGVLYRSGRERTPEVLEHCEDRRGYRLGAQQGAPDLVPTSLDCTALSPSLE